MNIMQRSSAKGLIIFYQQWFLSIPQQVIECAASILILHWRCGLFETSRTIQSLNVLSTSLMSHLTKKTLLSVYGEYYLWNKISVIFIPLFTHRVICPRGIWVLTHGTPSQGNRTHLIVGDIGTHLSLSMSREYYRQLNRNK